MSTRDLIQQGENSAIEFKSADVHLESLAKEIVRTSVNSSINAAIKIDEAELAELA